jgi:methyltransferase (TIGR00027 family)
MQTNQPSNTAENNAALRAFESMRPAEERICYDIYAKYFFSDALRQVKDIFPALDGLISSWENAFPGVCDAILLRTRFIDDCLEDAIKKGLQQMVIMGAGYDTRALRFEQLEENVAVFEVDHPATQKIKLERYMQNKLMIPDNVIFIPVDFNTEDIRKKLFDNGYNSSLRTFFIWEGVTYYVSTAAIDRTLSFISTNAPEGSSVVFDYFLPSVIDGTSHLVEAKALRVALKQLGEAFVFGLDFKKTKEFLKKRGYDLVENISATDYRKRYFTDLNQNRNVSGMFIFAHARVKQTNSQ